VSIQGNGYRRIVVAYDGSRSAQDALALALRLRDDAGTVVLACVVPSRPWHSAASDEAVRDALEMLADVQRELPAGIPVVERAPVAASAARGLTELAEAEGADLIAIGSAVGASGGRIGLARTAGRLLQGAPCAVAVAPPGARDSGPFRHVGVAVDGSAEAAAALAVGYAIARPSGSAMTLYSAIDQTSEAAALDAPNTRLAAQERLDSAADAAPPGVNPQTTLLYGPPGRVIGEACDGVVDLLIAGSRGYGPIQRALLGSVSEELIAHASHPVLIIPRQPVRGGSATRSVEAVEVG
jgi:nucleotide-binding universal stress UspA family protein